MSLHSSDNSYKSPTQVTEHDAQWKWVKQTITRAKSYEELLANLNVCKLHVRRESHICTVANVVGLIWVWCLTFAFTVMVDYEPGTRQEEIIHLQQRTTSKHICAVAIKLKLCLVLSGYGPYKHIAVCLEDKPGRVLSKAVLG